MIYSKFSYCNVKFLNFRYFLTCLSRRQHNTCSSSQFSIETYMAREVTLTILCKGETVAVKQYTVNREILLWFNINNQSIIKYHNLNSRVLHKSRQLMVNLQSHSYSREPPAVFMIVQKITQNIVPFVKEKLAWTTIIKTAYNSSVDE